MAKPKKFQRTVLKVLGGVGYFTLFMEWFWLLALYLPRIIDSEIGETIFPKSEPKPVEVPPVEAVPLEPSLLMTVIFVALGLAVFVLLVYVVFAKYIPGATKSARKVVHVATEKTVPIIAHKPLEKIPARKRNLLTERVQFWVKFGAASVPLVVVFVSRFHSSSIESQLLSLGFALMCGVSVAAFTLQIVIAQRWGAPKASVE
ncbi:hypothetical protein IPL85_01115 [Candidatus Saccharibacteria bacterium]|nr:MAG: hypothetical protein IPL85_01115 [Candidatus Saccharibacteria bacterium]